MCSRWKVCRYYFALCSFERLEKTLGTLGALCLWSIGG
jgi:hypothetical protein